MKVKRQSQWHAIPASDRFASLEISVGNIKCSGDALVPQIEWARDHFKSVQFSVGDTLNVHNYVSIGHAKYGVLPPAQAHKVALNEGDQWMQENVSRIARLLTPGSYDIRRWDDWMALAEVQQLIEGLTDLIQQNAGLEALLVRERSDYLRRRLLTGGTLPPQTIESLSRYVVEELAVFQHQGAQKACVHLYPGDLAILRRMKGAPGCPVELRNAHYVLFDA